MFSETLPGRICAKLFPSLPGAIAGTNAKIVQLDLEGAIKTTLLGVESEYGSWTDASDLTGSILSDLSENNKRWMQTMFALPSLNIRKLPQGQSLATTSIVENFFNNSNRTVADIDLAGMRVGTANDEAALLANALRGSTSRTLDSVRFGTLNKPGNHLAETSLNAIVSTLGYTYAKGHEFWAWAGYQSAYAKDPKTYTDVTNFWQHGTQLAGLSGAASYFTEGAMNAMSSVPPGIKYVPLVILGAVKLMPSLKDLKQSLILEDGYSYCALIPVIDDGLAYSQALCITSSGEWIHRIPDTRYGGVSTRFFRIVFSNSMYAKVYGPEGIRTPFGRQIASRDIPTSLATNSAQLGDSVLLFLAPPIKKQHYVLRDLVLEDVTYTVEGKELILRKVTATCDVFTGSIEKTWYNQYYETGFGLYTPRNSNIRKNTLEQWNKLDFNQLGFCADSVFTKVDSNIIYETDLAVRYAKARKDACKDNDWLTKEYMQGVTYGNIRDRILADSSIKAFYSVNNSGFMDELVFPDKLGNVTWSVNADVLTRTDVSDGGTTETYAINSTTRELLAVELSQGAVKSISDEQLIKIFDNDFQTVEAIRQASSAAYDPYLEMQPTLAGYVMKYQYYTPELALSNSGYPVYRYMSSPYNNAMILRMYADLKNIGDKIMSCITSFTGDAIIKKLIE